MEAKREGETGEKKSERGREKSEGLNRKEYRGIERIQTL